MRFADARSSPALQLTRAARRCLANMSIDETYELDLPSTGTKIHRFTYRLHHAHPLASQATSSQHSARSLLGGSISTNDPIVISLETPSVLSLSRGFVLSVTATHIVVGLDHSLTESPQARRALPHARPSDLVFRIDKDELAAGMGRIRDNVIQLFVAGGDEKRRRLVVDLEAPAFDKPVALDKLVPSNLNLDQRRAVEKVLSARDYALILGMPGTGKTTTIAEVLKALAKAGKSVLLTSYTHSAVDNILLKVKDEGLGILRLGNRDKVRSQASSRVEGGSLTCRRPFADHARSSSSHSGSGEQGDVAHSARQPAHVAPDRRDDLPRHQRVSRRLFRRLRNSMADLGFFYSPIFTKRRFDVCIVDEASQVTLPTCLGPLRFADSFVLVGDHNQLPPLVSILPSFLLSTSRLLSPSQVRNQAARKGGLDVSLFKRLSDAHPSSLVYLTQQYRMNEDIMLLSNKLVYQDRLKVGSDKVANQKLALRKPEALEECERWIRDVVDPE